VFGVFVRVALWSLVLARVGAAQLFGSFLGLVVGVWVCCLCGLGPVGVGFRLIFS
jgi:hypothetical protein